MAAAAPSRGLRRGAARSAHARSVLRRARLCAPLPTRQHQPWLKHIVTFDGWLAHIVAKIERRTGRRSVLSRWERSLPLVFLWPGAFRMHRASPLHEPE
jgi:hypothetical protein